MEGEKFEKKKLFSLKGRDPLFIYCNVPTNSHHIGTAVRNRFETHSAIHFWFLQKKFGAL